MVGGETASWISLISHALGTAPLTRTCIDYPPSLPARAAGRDSVRRCFFSSIYPPRYVLHIVRTYCVQCLSLR
jgi:hypothetical protein